MSQRTVGDRIGSRYRLTELIGSGGMGQIFKAVDLQMFQKTVAIKLLTTQMTVQGSLHLELQRRFEEEARVSALLGEHPRIIQVMDYGLDQDQPYLVMEYLGMPPQAHHLGAVIKAQRGMEPARVIRLGIQLCSALHHAHHFKFTLDSRSILGVIHRDIKPSNIFVMNEASVGETVKILDFGVAKVMSDITMSLGTQAAFVGTPSYASPEQLRGEELDSRSDIYSLGIVLYQMLTGELPLNPKTNSFSGWYEAHNFVSPSAFELVATQYKLPDTLQHAVMTCLKKEPNERPDSMAVLADMLQGSLMDPTAAPTTWIRSVSGGPTDPTRPFPATELPELNTVILSSALRQQLTALLVKGIGPIAPLLLQELSTQTLSETALIEQLVIHLPTDQQASFRRQALELLNLDVIQKTKTHPTQPSTFPSKPSSVPPSFQPTLPSPQPLDPEFLKKCQHHLTDLVGPMAAFVLQQVIAESSDLNQDQLIDRIAEEIPDAHKAKEFRRRLMQKP